MKAPILCATASENRLSLAPLSCQQPRCKDEPGDKRAASCRLPCPETNDLSHVSLPFERLCFPYFSLTSAMLTVRKMFQAAFSLAPYFATASGLVADWQFRFACQPSRDRHKTPYSPRNARRVERPNTGRITAFRCLWRHASGCGRR
jgi:hypothetical protein